MSDQGLRNQPPPSRLNAAKLETPEGRIVEHQWGAGGLACACACQGCGHPVLLTLSREGSSQITPATCRSCGQRHWLDGAFEGGVMKLNHEPRKGGRLDQ